MLVSIMINRINLFVVKIVFCVDEEWNDDDRSSKDGNAVRYMAEHL